MSEPQREEIDLIPGTTLLEFGATWCGHCQAIRPVVERMLSRFPEIRHVPIEDGPGRPLGRSFNVKLWPTFVFLRDGRIVHRLVRPSESSLVEGFSQLAAPMEPES